MVINVIFKAKEYLNRLLILISEYLYKKRYPGISRDAFFNGRNILISGDGIIRVKSGTYFGSNVKVVLNRGNVVDIGSNVRIARGVQIYCRSARAKQISSGDLDYRIGNISIGDNVWIGSNVYIGPGVKIGDNSVISANAVVVRDVPAKTIVKLNLNQIGF